MQKDDLQRKYEEFIEYCENNNPIYGRTIHGFMIFCNRDDSEFMEFAKTKMQ